MPPAPFEIAEPTADKVQELLDWLDTLRTQLGRDTAEMLYRAHGALERYRGHFLAHPEDPCAAGVLEMVLAPMLAHAAHSADTLRDILAHPPLGTPPDIPAWIWAPDPDVACMRGAEAILRRRGLPGDGELADWMAVSAGRAGYPVLPNTASAANTAAALAAAWALSGAGAAASLPASEGCGNVD